MADDTVERRLEDLESRYAFQEETIRQLDGEVHRLNTLLERVKLEVEQLRQHLASHGVGQSPSSLIDEVPPHY